MGKQQRPSHEELQRDEVAETLHETLETLRRNRFYIIGGLALIVLVFLVVAGYRAHRAAVLRETNTRYFEALAEFNRLQTLTDPAGREQAVERIETNLAALREAYPDTRLGREAIYLEGTLRFNQDRLEDAQRLYQEFIDAVEDPIQQARGEIALAYAFENDSFFETEESVRRDRITAAESRFQRAAELAPRNSYIYYYAQFGRARMAELTGDEEAARQIYQAIVDQRPPVGEEEEDLAARLEAEDDPLARMLIRQLNEQESILSFRKTAQLRLDRLGDEAGIADLAPQAGASVESTPSATPAPGSS